MIIIYSEKCLAYKSTGHPESPERVRLTYEHLSTKGYTFQEPSPCREEEVLSVHSSGMVEEVKTARFFDFDTPALSDIFHYALLSAGGALLAMKNALEGKPSFSLMRPPGHHAERNKPGGFCYFNNLAMAVHKALQNTSKVGIIDIDCHHGNGTENIFISHSRVLYVSLHQSPLYPGTGLVSRQNCLNYPLSPGTDEKAYLSTLEDALQEVKKFDPSLVAVSAGFDSYRKDPLANLLLDIPSYRKIAQLISSLNKPLFSVLEGGYNKDIPLCVESYLEGLEG